LSEWALLGKARQLKTLLDILINRRRFRVEENRTWSLANGQGGMKERIKKKEKRAGVKNVGAYRAHVKVIGSCVGEEGYTARRKE
jgi:hypothetical protein